MHRRAFPRNVIVPRRTAAQPLMLMLLLTLLLMLAALPLTGCGSADAGEAGQAPSADAPQEQLVDGNLTIAEELELFRERLPAASDLSGGAASRGELVRRYVEALASADTLALPPLVLNASEFADLYYPHTRFTTPPYEMGPGLLWYQIQSGSSKGLTRALQRLTREPARYHGHRCGAPSIEGPNRIWSECLVEVSGRTDQRVELQLFGSIIERNGRFKLISLANRL